MDLIIVSNRKYKSDFRKHLMDAALQNGSRVLHVCCDSDIILTTDRSTSYAFDESDAAEAAKKARELVGSQNIVLTGMHGTKSRFGLSLRGVFPIRCSSTMSQMISGMEPNGVELFAGFLSTCCGEIIATDALF
jgi:hypothetical protein